MKSLVIICLFLSITLSLNEYQSPRNDIYKENGDDWKGLCKSGHKQSPINIIKGVNTKDADIQLYLEYALGPANERKKFCYDGSRLTAELNLGLAKFQNEMGDLEIYEAQTVEIKVPSEHYVTEVFTPRYAAELQITHKLIKTDNPQRTYESGDVNYLVISILFDINQSVYEPFFEVMGISGK